jgi:hypothetical protein
MNGQDNKLKTESQVSENRERIVIGTKYDTGTVLLIN